MIIWHLAHTTPSISTGVVEVVCPKPTLAGGGRTAQGRDATDPQVFQMEIFSLAGQDFVDFQPAAVFRGP